MPPESDARGRALAKVGQVLKDKWRLDSLIGVGGMASVYAATHRNKMRVAVKMLNPELAGQTSIRERFQREGYLANTVEHPGAVQVLDDDVAEDGSAFLVMELLDGETIEARWERKGRRLAVPEVLAIIDRLLEVLAAAHAKGIVHRDIKPENLFLTRSGVLKVLDFGIARIFEATRDGKATRAGLVMGTPAFMAPEQALAKWDSVDGRTDIWATGATMFTLLTGRHVHEGASGNEQLIRSAMTPPRSVAAVDPNLPAAVVAFVDKALAFDRDLRWLDARAMRDALREVYHSIGDPGGAPSSMRSVPRVSVADPSEAVPVPPASEPSFSGIDPAALQAHLLARTTEREARAAELQRVLPIVTEISQRLAGAHRSVAAIQERVMAARNERAALDEQFRRQSAARSAGIGEARKLVREATLGFAIAALADVATFGAPFSESRDTIKKLARASEARTRDEAIYADALVAYDARGLRTGLVVILAGLTLVVLLFLLPFILHAIIMSGAPLPPAPG
jgi:serine/threonine protein kinase